MTHFAIRLVRDASDVDLAITGTLPEGEKLHRKVILEPGLLKDGCQHVKLTGIFHSIQTGLLLTLYWHTIGAKDVLMMPLEGRGILDLTRFGGLENPRHEGSSGMVVLVAERLSAGAKHFALSLEFSKQRN